MEPLTYVFGSITIAVVSGVVGRSIGSHKKVREDTCVERREGCVKLLTTKIDNLENKIDNLTEFVKNGGRTN